MIEKGKTYYAHLKQLVDYEFDDYGDPVNHVYAMVTIAASLQVEGNLGWAGIAWCSPRDQFCKRTGRRIAEGRMSNLKTQRAFQLPSGGLNELHPFDLIHAAVHRFNTYYFDNDKWPGAPSWALSLQLTPRKAA
jgi:hypothetical protein